MSRRTSVLIADDEPTLRDAIRAVLATDPRIEVVGAAPDADGAVALARSHTPDVALLDLHMPGGGVAAAREIRISSPATRVVAFTAYTDASLVTDMVSSGAIGYLVKGDAGADEIVQAVHDAAAGRAVMSREITGIVVSRLVGALEESESRRTQTAKLEQTRVEMLEILAHELLTPVAVVQGAAMLLADPELGGSHEIEHLVGGVVRAGDRLKRIVRNITYLGHLNGERTPTIRATSSSVIVKAALVDCDDARITRTGPDDLEIWTDPELAATAVREVVDNALIFSEGSVELCVGSSEGSVSVLVRDRGPGPGIAASLIAPFVQDDSSSTRGYGGLGLGLYFTRRVMEALDGTVSIAERDGGGTDAALTFPNYAGTR